MVQVDPIKLVLIAPCTKRLILGCDEPLSTFDFKLILRRCTTGVLRGVTGIFGKASAGFQKSGLVGLATGVGQGVIGAGVGVTAGAVGFAARVVEGIDATVGAVGACRTLLACHVIDTRFEPSSLDLNGVV